MSILPNFARRGLAFAKKLVTRREPAESRIKDVQVKHAFDIAKDVAGAELNHLFGAVPMDVVACRGDCLLADSTCEHIRRLGGGEDGIDAAAGPHVQDTLARGHFGQHRLPEKAGNFGDRLDLR
jgi:hypothetical protein